MAGFNPQFMSGKGPNEWSSKDFESILSERGQESHVDQGDTKPIVLPIPSEGVPHETEIPLDTASSLPDATPSFERKRERIEIKDVVYSPIDGGGWVLDFTINEFELELIESLKKIKTYSAFIRNINTIELTNGRTKVSIIAERNDNIGKDIVSVVQVLNRLLNATEQNLELILPPEYVDNIETKIDRKARRIYDNYYRLMEVLGNLDKGPIHEVKKSGLGSRILKFIRKNDQTESVSSGNGSNNEILKAFESIVTGDEFNREDGKTYGYAYRLVSEKARDKVRLKTLVTNRLKAITVLYSGANNNEYRDIAPLAVEYLLWLLFECSEPNIIYEFFQNIEEENLTSIPSLLNYIRTKRLEGSMIGIQEEARAKDNLVREFIDTLNRSLPEDAETEYNFDYKIPAGANILNNTLKNSVLGENIDKNNKLFDFSVQPNGRVNALYEAYTRGRREVINKVYGADNDPLKFGLTKVIALLRSRGVDSQLLNLLSNGFIDQDSAFDEIYFFIQAVVSNRTMIGPKDPNRYILNLFDTIIPENALPQRVEAEDLDKFKVIIVARLIFDILLNKVDQQQLVEEAKQTNPFLDLRLIQYLPDDLRVLLEKRVNQKDTPFTISDISEEEKEKFRKEAEVRRWIIELLTKVVEDYKNNQAGGYDSIIEKYKTQFSLRMRRLSLEDKDINKYILQFNELITNIGRELFEIISSLNIENEEKIMLMNRILKEKLSIYMNQLQALTVLVPDQIPVDLTNLEKKAEPERIKPEDYVKVVGRDPREGFSTDKVAFSEGSEALDVISSLEQIGRINSQDIPMKCINFI